MAMDGFPRTSTDKNFTFAISAGETSEMPRKYRMSFDIKFLKMLLCSAALAFL